MYNFFFVIWTQEFLKNLVHISFSREFLRNLAKNLPINHIHSKVSSDPKSIKQDEAIFEFSQEQLAEIKELMKWNN